MRRLALVVIVLAACTSQPTITPSPTVTLAPAITSSPAITPSSAASQTQWQEPPAYSFTLSAQCGERALIGVFHVEVANGVPVAARGLEGWYVTHQIDPRMLPTLNDLIGIAARARAERAAAVSVELDPTDGHPLSVSIDHIANAIDDEECYEVTDYQLDP